MASPVYEPKSRKLKEIRHRISEESWQTRVEEAHRRKEAVKEIIQRVTQGTSQNVAIREVVGDSKRSATLRDMAKYRRKGFEGLIDRRTPRDPGIPAAVRDAIIVARMANPSISVEQVGAIIRRRFRATPPSGSTIKRLWKDAGLERGAGRPREADAGTVAQADETRVIESLEAAGFQLLQAAEAETGAVAALVNTVLDAAEKLPEPGPPPSEEVALRNKRGQLTAAYNKSRRKAPGELTAPAYRTAAEKAEERDLGRLSFRDQQPGTIEQKVWALVCMPALTRVRSRTEDLRSPQAQLLEELCGYDYQVETIRKLVSEWTVAGLPALLQQTHAATWNQVSMERWETDYRSYVVYVDNVVKPLWTDLFTKAAKVSSTGRVQPALTTTFVNTGVGVPIYFETFSGTAPLSPRVLALLQRVEQETEQPVGRLTVIDGECCSALLLHQFKLDERDLVVPLSARMVKPERFHFGRGSAFRPYRDGDLLREGRITLRDSGDAKVEVDARAVVIQPRGKDRWHVLVTLADPDVWTARELADAYYGRWPNQEGFFRNANQSVGLKEVHGYGKRVVTNTAVLTQLEEVESRIARTHERQIKNAEQHARIEQQLTELELDLRKVSRHRAKREERVDAGLEAEHTHTRAFASASAELRESSERERELEQRRTTLEAKFSKLTSNAEKQQAQLEKWEEKRQKLESRKEILEADVSQDTLFTTMKLTLAMLVSFFVREYMSRPISWETFIERIGLLRGRRETTSDTLTIIIYGNRRDPKLMKQLAEACEHINERNLTREGKLLRYAVEWPEVPPKGWAE
jgi:hypothetical protein